MASKRKKKRENPDHKIQIREKSAQFILNAIKLFSHSYSGLKNLYCPGQIFGGRQLAVVFSDGDTKNIVRCI